MRTRPVLLTAFALVVGCAEPNDSDAPDSVGAPPSAEVPPLSAPPPAADAPPDPSIAPLEPPVDLIHALRSEVAVSSAYRDRSAEIARLVDGDLETAWNSASGDLVGAWIEVRIPVEAVVTSLEMTAGYTKTGGETDLFTANHRVVSLRVLRDGNEVGSFELDTDTRELQSLPLTGPGGVYRVEVGETLPGTRSDWRELCVSELRWMGRAPQMNPGERIPRLAVGELPAPPDEATQLDLEALARTLRQQSRSLLNAWKRMEQEVAEQALNTGDPDFADEEIERRRASVRRAFLRIAEMTDPVDGLAADRVRAAGRAVGPPDPEMPAAAMAGLAEAVGTAEARCDWARVHAQLRMSAILGMIRRLDNLEEVNAGFGDSTRESRAELRRLERAASAVRRVRDRIAAGREFDDTELRELDLATESPTHGAPLLEQLDQVKARCHPET